MELKSLSRERIQGGEIQGPECYNRMTCHHIEVRKGKAHTKGHLPKLASDNIVVRETLPRRTLCKKGQFQFIVLLVFLYANRRK